MQWHDVDTMFHENPAMCSNVSRGRGPIYGRDGTTSLLFFVNALSRPFKSRIHSRRINSLIVIF